MNKFRVFVLALCCLAQPELSSEELRFSIGGRFKFDSVYSSRLSQGQNDTNLADIAFVPSSVVLDDPDAQSKYSFSHRESRFWSTLHLPLSDRDLSAYVEADLMGTRTTANGTRLTGLPRLRHYFLKYQGLVLGQTNTGFFNVSSFPEINDFNGPVGTTVLRQRLLSYTHSFRWGNASLSFEDSETSLATTTGLRLASNDERYPDITLKLSSTGDWGNVSVSGLFRELINKGSVTDKTWTGGINVSGRLLLARDDNLRFSLVWGKGLGRYVSSGLFSDALLDDAGRLYTVESTSINIAYQHWWTRKLRSNLAIATSWAENPVLINSAQTNRAFYSSHLNLIWSPRLAIKLGLEWLYGWREREDGADGELNRIQLSASYRF